MSTFERKQTAASDDKKSGTDEYDVDERLVDAVATVAVVNVVMQRLLTTAIDSMKPHIETKAIAREISGGSNMVDDDSDDE